MHLLNISLVLAASLASTAQARRSIEPHLHPRSYDNNTYPVTSTVIVSPLPMGTGVVSLAETLTTKTSNATLTYTLESGSSTTVITTTVMSTETLTFTKTVYATRGDGDASESDIDGSNKAATSAGGTTDEPTTTITSSSTTTRTVTVESAGTPGGDDLTAQATDYAGDNYGSPGTSVGGGSGAAPGTGCAAIATVTETIKSTITVTARPSTSTDTPSSSTIQDAGYGSITLSSSATAPYTNGTTAAHSTRTKKNCKPSGFTTRPAPYRKRAKRV